MTAQRFVIIAGARTGSSHLRSCLWEHPEIRCYGEAFAANLVFRSRSVPAAEMARLKDQDPIGYMENIFADNRGKPIVGFKLFQQYPAEALRWALAEEQIKKVVLFRANPLARYASTLASKATRAWGPVLERPLVTFDQREFTRQANSYLGFFRMVMQTLNESEQNYFCIRNDELDCIERLQALVKFLGATAPLAGLGDKDEWVRGSSDIVSRFSNPEVVTAFLRDTGLMGWAYESSVRLEPLAAERLPQGAQA